MRCVPSLGLASAVIVSLALAACGGKDAPEKGGASEPAEEHDHTAPHGGEVLELGEEEGHLEMMHDHDGGKVTVYVYGKSFEEPVAVARPVITIQAKDGTMAEVPLTALDPKPDGTAQAWKGEHPALISDPWNGRIRVVLDGKTLQSPLEGPAHTHK